MSSSGSVPLLGTEALVFGPQPLGFKQTDAHALRWQLLRNPRFSWARDALRDLSSYWSEILLALPLLGVLDGRRLLDDLAAWLHTGNSGILSFPLENIQMSPLVVVSHLMQYQELIEMYPERQLDVLPVVSETLGLCIGHLSAAAVSCSKQEYQLQHYGGVAVRMAMLVGALVDAKNTSMGEDNRAKSYSLSWDSPNDLTVLEQILAAFPRAYISVTQDERRVTVTTPAGDAGQLLNRLEPSGFGVVEIGLRGYFHWHGFKNELPSAIGFCDSRPEFRFIDCSSLNTPSRSTVTGEYFDAGTLHRHLLSSILVERSDWRKSFVKLLGSVEDGSKLQLTYIGSESCVPAFVKNSHRLKFKQVHAPGPKLLDPLAEPVSPKFHPAGDFVAVTGMACQLPGAADIDAFWSLLVTGTSQHTEVPPSRFGFDTPWRHAERQGQRWYGNFLEDYDKFDEKFFAKTPRESISTDPQHRLMLQVAYQAVEQSGYLNSPNRDRSIGCYIGVGLGDYESNVACHPATAYTAVGNLRAFTAGKISHYFGWTGPSLTIDTACSSSTVAIHTACKAILSGECRAALVGGVNVMTSPEWFQNLAAASFLSPSGQCKPFDTEADGYCRGEAVGAVFLKKLSSAVAHGDKIFGVIAASAVYQNQNSTTITVPNAPSLSGLFEDVIQQSRISPKDISYVEAHGTGTPVGDPIEYESVRRVLGGDKGCGDLSIGSVKGLIGHSEAASGVVALLKVLLMLHHQFIPPQASFRAFCGNLKASASDNMTISTSLIPWRKEFKAALINNYGASGSNAALVVTQPPGDTVATNYSAALLPNPKRYPVALLALDEWGLRRATERLVSFLKSNTTSLPEDIAFQLVRQSNWSLPRSLILSFGSVTELIDKLSVSGNEADKVAGIEVPFPRPLILCFGGQISQYIGLDKTFYEEAKILRKHLDRCDEICKSLGTSIYPGIFQKIPLYDIVTLHLALFSLQYSCARSWIDCGAKVAAVVGHSFGELTAACISGIMSLVDAIKVVAGRARLIRDHWGSEKGRMVVVRSDQKTVEELLAEAHRQCTEEPAATIACFNAERSFTIAGSTKSIDAILNIASSSSAFSSMETKVLDVTNAFHCSLVDPIDNGLRELAQGTAFKEATIPIEHATKLELSGKPSQDFFANHLREPVYFHQAIQRLSRRFPSSIWLEAGSRSSITRMVNRVLGPNSTNHFQSVDITGDNSFKCLTDTTTSLWRQGLSLTFWPHHNIQADDYRPIILPPYQFQKSRHWMDLTTPKTTIVTGSQPEPVTESKAMWALLSRGGQESRSYKFKVTADSANFKKILNSHRLMSVYPICPSTLQLDILIDALISLRAEYANKTMKPRLLGMNNHAPLTLSLSRAVWFDVYITEAESHVWNWKLFSQGETVEDPSVLHTSGTISFDSISNASVLDGFDRYARLIRRSRCLDLLGSWDADEIMQGRSIYRAFSDIVEYGDIFCGLQKLVGKAGESAGLIKAAYNKDSWFDFALADCFCQVAGIYINTISKKDGDEIFISDKIDQWFRSPRINYYDSSPGIWEVYACHHQPSEREFLSDIFVFDSRDGSLLEVIIGVHYLKVAKLGLRRAVAKTADAAAEQLTNGSRDLSEGYLNSTGARASLSAGPTELEEITGPDFSKNPAGDEKKRLKEVIANLSGLKSDQISDNSGLADIGIDSLMGMELAREIESAFKCTMNVTDFQQLVNFRDLSDLLLKALRIHDNQNTTHAHEDLHTQGTNTLGSNGHMEGKVNGFSGTFPPNYNSIRPNVTQLPANVIIDTFLQFKMRTDGYILAGRFSGYVDDVLPRLDSLSVAYICDAFEQLGSSFRSMEPGGTLQGIPYLPRYEKFVALLYQLLEKKSGIIEMVDTQILRTAVPVPSTPAATLLQELRNEYPSHVHDYDLMSWTSSKLADCLAGKAEGLQVIFGTSEGREAASAMYGQSPINLVWITQLSDFLRHLISRLPRTTEALKIFEIGAGTGGTTTKLISVFSELEVPIQYTITDISSSLVSAARKRFKQHDFLEYRVFDLEKPVPPELRHSQHIVLATNCVHIAHNIVDATSNLRELLRPDGFLVMLEMTQTPAWVDLVFGLLDGWWQFDDGRNHALVSAPMWRDTLQRSGFGHVEWTEGDLPENGIQKLILAMASSSSQEGNSEAPLARIPSRKSAELEALKSREAAVDAYVRNFSADIFISRPPENVCPSKPHAYAQASVVLITGATGSLGCHLVQRFAELPNIRTVICLNRCSITDAVTRQEQALQTRGIHLSAGAISKLKVFQTDTSSANLGLTESDYEYITHNTTYIVHNAWSMSLTRPIDNYVAQFNTMRNLLILARDTYERLQWQGSSDRVVFQFISSIAVVGLDPLRTGTALVQEERMPVETALPNGYSDAKLVCERMVEKTLNCYPYAFRAMAVRLGQVAGSRVTGYWNPVEHFPIILKSAQTLGALPHLEGVRTVISSRLPVPMNAFEATPS
ncbi:BcPKS17, polyketide synthase [Ustulina deusta]|nr:BcPKS17, polyketide synthase [Ustulina deusta]